MVELNEQAKSYMERLNFRNIVLNLEKITS